MRPVRITMALLGSLLALVSVALLAAGGALVGIHATQRDDDGYYRADRESFRTSTYALTSEEIDLHLDVEDADLGFLDDIGRARIDVRGVGGSIFVGIGPSASVDRYLAASAHDEIDGVAGGGATRYRRLPGEQQPARPDAQPFWVASTAGEGLQRIDWDLADGSWTVVVMNADATRDVEVAATVAVKTGIMLPIGLGLLAGAVLLGALAAVGLIIGLRRDAVTEPHAATTPRVGTMTTSPIRLRGELDQSLSRWLWLVKWLLVLPHVFVLALLWPITALLTIAAGFAILFTGRYPASFFQFNVGVMRWTWRVTFYAFTFGTDRYPPFSLDPEPEYPADLEVDRPATLSRGLVLVKWWLLAIPHYLVLAIFGSGFAWWGWGWGTNGDGRAIGGAGLVGILVLIAGVSLAVTRRYPQSIFDFVMGMQRWTYRVLVYAALMRDEYPPFRLDVGGTEPSTSPPTDEAGADAPRAAA